MPTSPNHTTSADVDEPTPTTTADVDHPTPSTSADVDHPTPTTSADVDHPTPTTTADVDHPTPSTSADVDEPSPNATAIVGNLSIDDPSEPFTRRSWRYAVRRNLRRGRELIGDDPFFLPLVLRATPTGTVRRLSDSTQLVIEGMPRSGNTFAFFAIKHAERLAGREVVLSSHVHTPSAVKAAVASRFPTMVVIRQPLDTIVSLLIAVPHVRFGEAIDEWVHHHRELLPYLDRFIPVTFDEVTTDFGSVTARINDRFGTAFALYEPSPENDAAVFAAIDHNHIVLHGGTENVVPRPSELRRAEKEWLLEQLAAPEYKNRLADADALYEQYTQR